MLIIKIKKVLKKLLIKVQELVEHNIYHIDLAQRPNKIFPNTNVLLQLPSNPEIIDLDGHSAIYTEFFSDKALKKTESSLAMLVMETLTKMNLETYLNSMDISGLLAPMELENAIVENILATNKKLDSLMIQDFLKSELTLDRIDFYLDKLGRKRIL